MGDRHALDRLALRFAESRRDPCLVVGEHVYTYESVWANATELAARWARAGVKPRDVVAFLLPNGITLPISYVACLIGGYVACPILKSNHPDLVRAILALVKPTLVVEEPPETSPDATIALVPELPHGPDAPYLIMFTSGLTGQPKAMLHGAGNVLASARAFAELTGMSRQTRLYHVLPMAYMAGFLNAFQAPLSVGSTIVVGPLFSPESAVDFWERPLAHGVNTLSITPTIAAALSRLTRNRETIARLRTTVTQVQCTSASIPAAVRNRFHEVFGLHLQDCYGMTELGGPLSFQARADAERGVELTTPIDGLSVDIRNDGELWLRSPHAMLGYLEEVALVRPFDAEGYFDTGDLAAQEDGKIAITGRRKDIVIRGGVNVAPTRVESVLGLAPGVDEVAVIGVPHPFWGEAIVACVVGTEKARPDLGVEVQRWANDHLAAHERPDRVEILDALPRSFIGKIDKRELKRRYGA